MINKKKLFENLLDGAEVSLKQSASFYDKLQGICALLHDNVPYYDWVGFYLVDTENKRELLLGPYSGSKTDHTRIRFGIGVCGDSAELKTTRIVQDVSEEDNYLSCNIDVKSEIVVPIMSGDCVDGILDIDSHSEAPFSEEDAVFLEKICKLILSSYF